MPFTPDKCPLGAENFGVNSPAIASAWPATPNFISAGKFFSDQMTVMFFTVFHPTVVLNPVAHRLENFTEDSATRAIFHGQDGDKPNPL